MGRLGQRLTHCKRGHEFTPDNTRISDKRIGGVVVRQDRSCIECNKTRSHNYYKTNKAAANQKTKTDRANNPDKHQERHLLKMFNITLEQYRKLLEEQGGKCAICSATNPGGPHPRGNFPVDHDHSCCPGKTSCGKCVRGLVCWGCNSGLGNFRDDIDALASAIKYVCKHRFKKYCRLIEAA